jgi:hypothetical protein
MDYSEIAQPWAKSQQNTNLRLPMDCNNIFYYVVHPGHLEWVEKEIPGKGKTKPKIISTFVPRFDAEFIRAGVNGVKQIRGDIGDAGGRLGQLQQDGYTVLDFNKYDYMRTYPAKGGTYYAPKWAKIQTIANRVIREFDHTGFLLWRLQLILSGAAPEPHPVFIDLMINDFLKVPNRWANRQHEPVAKAQYEKQSNKLIRMKQAAAEITKNGIAATYQGIIDGLK